MKNRKETNQLYDQILKKAQETNTVKQTLRKLAQTDLFFLLTRICKRKDIDRDWLYERTREVEANPNGYIDLWAREHYKSTLITYGLTIQDILNDPDITVGIFSYKIGAATEFLKQIKREFEENKLLKSLFPDILYTNPQHQSPRWNETGLICKRKTNPKEATVEAHGVVESLPTGKHFKLCLFDDMVNEKSVGTPDQIKKTTDAWELALNLSTEGGARRYIGTFYSFADTYHTIIEREAAIPRIYPGTDNGRSDGKPVFWTQEYYDERRKHTSPYIFSCQILLNPKIDSTLGFKQEWLRFWPARNLHKLNTYIIVDPASTKKKRSDYTAAIVVGMGEDDNFYIIDMVRDRLMLSEKARILMDLHRRYRPIHVYYESYGAMADVQHIRSEMDREQYRFNISEVGGKIGKEDRIQKLMPLFEQNRIYLPDTCIRTNYESVSQDLTQVFIQEEYKNWPFSRHDDLLDSLSRICDPNVHIRRPAPRRRRGAMTATTEYNWESI